MYTLGSRAKLEHVLCDPASVGAELVDADRGGDVTYHGPGQLVGYPIVSLAEWRGGQRDVVAYVRKLEDVLIAVCSDFGITAGRSNGYTGVWVGDEKIAAIGVRVARGRTRHGFALNVDPDLSMFEHIVPCGIPDRGVTSMAQVLGRPVDDAGGRRPGRRAFRGAVRRQRSRNATTSRGSDPCVPPGSRSRSPPSVPDWMRVRAHFDDGYLELKQLARRLDLHTVCEEAGCPNIYECWADRTATFMILGDRCTRACGFCLVDTRKPLALDPERAATCRRRDRRARSRARGHHVRRARRSPRRRRVGVRGDGRRHPGDESGHRGRAPHRRLQGRRGGARDDLRRAPRRVEPQPRNRRPAAACGAAVGRLRPFARRSRAGPGRGARHEVGPHPRARRDRRRGARRDRRPAGRRRRDPDDRPVPAPVG